MYFVPLSQLESVELLIHSLRAAAGEVDCRSCPAARVCMKQCLTIADSVEQMLHAGALPVLGEQTESAGRPDPDKEPPEKPWLKGKGGLKVIK